MVFKFLRIGPLLGVLLIGSGCPIGGPSGSSPTTLQPPAGSVSGMASDAPGTETEADGDVQDATSHDTTQATPNTVAGSPIGGTPQGPCLTRFQDVVAVVGDEERGLVTVKGYVFCGRDPMGGAEVTVLPTAGEAHKGRTDPIGCFQVDLPARLGEAVKLESCCSHQGIPFSFTAVVSPSAEFVPCDPSFRMVESKELEFKTYEIQREAPLKINREAPNEIKNLPDLKRRQIEPPRDPTHNR